MLRKSAVLAALSCLIFTGMALGQSSAKPLTNDDVVAMVKGHLADNTIISAIQSQDSSFDVSAAALLKLNQAGVKPGVLDAMIAAAGKQRAAAQAGAQAQVPQATFQQALQQGMNQAQQTQGAPAANPNLPSVALVQGAAKQNLTPSRTQVAQTKEKVSTLNALAQSGALTQALNSVAMTAATSAAMKGNPAGINMMPMAAPMTTLAQTFMSHHKPTVTDVWALPGQKGEMVLHTNQPSFEVHYESIPGINPAEYEPVLLKLEPTPNNFRLVGATQAKQDAMETAAADWGMYSSFVEERIAAQVEKVSDGNYHVQPSAALAAGEYGIALRPVNKNKKFSGSSIAQNVGDGLIFDSVWAFEVQ
jgi:hypothetical protein